MSEKVSEQMEQLHERLFLAIESLKKERDTFQEEMLRLGGAAGKYREALEKIIKEDVHRWSNGEEVHGECGMIALVALGRAE